MAEAGEGLARFLRSQMEAGVRESGSLGVAVSHDIPMSLLLHRYFGVREAKGVWPAFLEGILLRQESPGHYALHWRGNVATL